MHNRSLNLLPKFNFLLLRKIFSIFLKLVPPCSAFVLFFLCSLRLISLSLMPILLICFFSTVITAGLTKQSSVISVAILGNRFLSVVSVHLLPGLVDGIGNGLPFCWIIYAPSFRLISSDRSFILLLL